MNLLDLKFDNRFSNSLPADPNPENRPRQVHNAAYSWATPKAFESPQLMAFSPEVAELVGINPAEDPATLANLFSGKQLLPGMQPYAMCYGGHQFGNWAGQLGDGRAINLGEVVNSQGDHWALQLKGAGATPYSRTADGYAALRSSIREFLCSEAMFHLGVPTTRALTLVATGEKVVRDMFYDGRPQLEIGAVVCRVAPSFIRFGQFQLPASRGDLALLKQFADFTLTSHFPQLGEPCSESYAAMFAEVCRLTAEMVAHWERVGFVHGVMNTDNMSILGLTIDYGPYGWLDNYDPEWTPNTTDAERRRYRFGHQAEIALWNLYQLGSALYPLVEDLKPLEAGIALYQRHHGEQRQQMMRAKLGIETAGETTADSDFFDELRQLLAAVETDMTLFYRALATMDVATLCDSKTTDESLLQPLADCYYRPEQLGEQYMQRMGNWLRHYGTRLQQENSADQPRQARMNRVNPKYVLRNYLAQLAIDKADQGDLSLLHELFEVMKNPYDEQPEFDHHAGKRPDWARQRAGCSMLSCSS
ncbi:MAG: YdiU family protein [Gammaproteobacteria bacterium]|nr:YdiU family protein [Gammaproteobacteria bacterium]